MGGHSLRFGMATLATWIALGAPPDALAQFPGDSLRDRLVGSWTHSAIVLERQGEKVEPYGPSPQGLLTFQPDGSFSSMIIRSDVPRIASNNRFTATAEEMKAVYLGAICYYGRYELDESSGVLTLHVKASSYANYNGTRETRRVALQGDELRLTNPNPYMGGTSYLTLRRFRP